MYKVFATRTLPEVALKKLKEKCEVTINYENRKLLEQELINQIKDMDGLICFLDDKITRSILKSNLKLKVVANFGVGYNNVDVKSATEFGIMLTNTPGILDDTTAELAFALLLAVSRRVVEADYFLRSGQWKTGWEFDLFQGLDVHHKTLGIIGMGNIGKALAKKVSGFDMNILYHNRSPVDTETERKLNAKYVDKETLLKESDYISLHIPLTPDTHYFIGEKEFSMMKKTAIFINTSRGEVVNELALYHALKSKTIFGAGLDVFEKEPTLTDGLADLENIVVLPHIGSASVETRNLMAMMVVDNVIAGMEGIIPPNLVNKELLGLRRN